MPAQGTGKTVLKDVKEELAIYYLAGRSLLFRHALLSNDGQGSKPRQGNLFARIHDKTICVEEHSFLL